MGEGGQRPARVFPWQNYQLDFLPSSLGVKCAPGAKLLQPGPAEYIRQICHSAVGSEQMSTAQR